MGNLTKCKMVLNDTLIDSTSRMGILSPYTTTKKLTIGLLGGNEPCELKDSNKYYRAYISVPNVNDFLRENHIVEYKSLYFHNLENTTMIFNTHYLGPGYNTEFWNVTARNWCSNTTNPPLFPKIQTISDKSNQTFKDIASHFCKYTLFTRYFPTNVTCQFGFNESNYTLQRFFFVDYVHHEVNGSHTHNPRCTGSDSGNKYSVTVNAPAQVFAVQGAFVRYEPGNPNSIRVYGTDNDLEYPFKFDNDVNNNRTYYRINISDWCAKDTPTTTTTTTTTTTPVNASDTLSATQIVLPFTFLIVAAAALGALAVWAAAVR